MFGTTAHLHHDYRSLLCRTVPESCHDSALRHRHHTLSRRRTRAQQVGHQGRGHPLRHGAATLPLPNSQGHLPPYMGERQTVSEEDGRRHPRSLHHCLGIRLFRHHGCGAVTRRKLYRPAGQGHRTHLPAPGLQLAPRCQPHCRRRSQGNRRLHHWRALYRSLRFLTAHGLLFPALCTHLFPLHCHHRRHPPRERLLALGHR